MARSWKESFFAYASGMLFAVGWWLFIDADIYARSQDWNVKPNGLHYLPAVFSTVALVMINAVSWQDITGNDKFLGDSNERWARLWLFGAFTIAFGAIIAAIWVASAIWFADKNADSDYPGLALIFQNLLIFASACAYRYARTTAEQTDDELLL